MNNIHLLITALILAAIFAVYSHAQPESDIAIPAEKMTYERSIPNLGNAENENWQKLRDERRMAREQILANIKENIKAEKQNLQQEKIQPVKTGNLKAMEAREKHPNENAKDHKEIVPPGLNHERMEPPGHPGNLHPGLIR